MVTGRGFPLKNRMPPEFFIQEAFFHGQHTGIMAYLRD
jgi:hypothetical protein